MSKLLQIIGLFCKGAIQKRLYSAKETYNFKEPAHCSHPIYKMCISLCACSIERQGAQSRVPSRNSQIVKIIKSKFLKSRHSQMSARCSVTYAYGCTYAYALQPIPLGVSFSKAQNSKLEHLFCQGTLCGTFILYWIRVGFSCSIVL